jgi:hypothetical protein
MNEEQRKALLGSIAAGRLAVICGAGLSRPWPSSLPLAANVSDACWQKRRPIEQLPDELRWDLGALAQHFFATGQMDHFLQGLVPWEELGGPPNKGHAAIGDLIMCGGVHSVLSANFDDMIERWIWGHRIDFNASLDGVGAAASQANHPPLLKFHGCIRDRRSTVWCEGQLSEAIIAERIEASKAWMSLNLKQDKDFLIVGFFSDWSYLNDLFATLLSAGKHRVFVVDPCELDVLREKAAGLSKVLDDAAVEIQHIKMSSDEFFDGLRAAFSVAWLRELLHAGSAAFEALTGGAASAEELEPDMQDTDSLYALRCDAEGGTSVYGARLRLPPPDHSEVGTVHLLLRRKGAVLEGPLWNLQGRRIRVINGRNRMVSQAKSDFGRDEPPGIEQAEITIVANAADYDAPANIVREGEATHLIRRGSASQWTRFTPAFVEELAE